MARQQTFLLALRKQIGPATVFNAPALFDAAKGFTWTDLPREALPALGDLFDKAAHASVKQLRIVPTRYSTILTPGEVIRIRADIAALLGVPPPPTPSPTPTAVPTAVPTDTPIPTPTVIGLGKRLRLAVSKGRLEAFSDGVIAIIITIMVLELRPPDGTTLESLAR